MKKLIIILAGILLLCCKKEQPFKDFGCLYGTNKVTGQRQYIKCVHREIYQAGNNQTAANTIAARLHLPAQDVSYWNAFTGIEFHANSKCDCN